MENKFIFANIYFLRQLDKNYGWNLAPKSTLGARGVTPELQD